MSGKQSDKYIHDHDEKNPKQPQHQKLSKQIIQSMKTPLKNSE